jgi:hypothetical protein
VARTGRTGKAAVEMERNVQIFFYRLPESLANSLPARKRLLATLQFSLKASGKKANHGVGGKYLSHSFQCVQ